jgi:pyruvate/2-oxoglutarate dehydrogenase complex dihydrolipoamide dehydrogenase (E3) component
MAKSGSMEKSADKKYDLAIIGSGSAGLTAAAFAVQLGAHVALLEKNRLGGDCTWTGCVPSKTVLKAAKVAHQMRTASFYGLPAVEPKLDFKSVMTRVRTVIDEVYRYESPEALRAQEIDVFLQAAHFADPHTVAVGDTTLRAQRILLATGAYPFVPPISGLDKITYLTYETIWNLELLPNHLLVLGAGPIGCEMGQAFHRLGARVTLIEGEGRVLPRDDPDASRVLDEVFRAEGIELRLNAKAERTWQNGNDIHIVAGGEEIVGDALLVAIGRRPNVVGLELEKAGVVYSAKGIEVDDHLRTSQKHIFAAGDCIGSYQFTHYAGWQGFMAVRNALLPGASRGVSERVPWTTFTDPEVAHVGLTEEQARKKFGDTFNTLEWPMERVDRAQAEGDTAGFVKLVHKKDGTLLGATIVAGRAGEMIHEWILALEHNLRVGDLAGVIHVYPTYSTASMQAAAAIRVQQWLSSPSGRVIRHLARIMR